MIKEEISQKIEAVKKEIHDTPYDKSSQFHHGVLKAKLARLREMLEIKSQKSGGGVGYAIKHSGDASVVLVGLPSVGKSSLLNRITNAESKVGNYDFTTLGVVPGMMEYRGVKIQILDLPGIIEGASGNKGFGKKVLSVVRASDMVVLMTDVERMGWLAKVKQELYEVGVRLNKKPPKIQVSKTDRGGVRIVDPFGSFDNSMLVDMAKEMGFGNILIQIKERLNQLDEFVDGLVKSRVYLPSVEVVNKIDQKQSNKKSETDGVLWISASQGIGIEDFKEAIWQGLGLVRVYLKRERTGRADYRRPLIMKSDKTIDDVLKKISAEMRDDVKRACIWGKKAKFPGQEVSFTFPVFDEMELWFGR